MRKEALYYKKLKNKNVRCLLCPHHCIIENNMCGYCGVRKNMDGTLFTLNYGVISSMAIDPIEKKPLHTWNAGSQILSIGSVGCNFSCLFCQNYEISREFKKPEPELDLFYPEQVVKKTIELGLKSIAYTYNEPTVFYEMVFEIAKVAKSKGLANVLVTNGYICKEPFLELAPYIDAMNIDVKSYDDKKYMDICHGHLEPVLQTIELAIKAGIHVEISCLIVPGLNDEIKAYHKFFEILLHRCGDVYIHLSRYFPRFRYEEPSTDIQLMLEIQSVGRQYFSQVTLGNVR